MCGTGFANDRARATWANREINAVLLTASKIFNVAMYSDVYELIWFKAGEAIDTILHFDTNISDTGLDQGHTDASKQTLVPIFS